MKTRALLLAAACAAFALVSSAADRPPLLAKGTAAPDFTAQQPDGSTIKLSDFSGKIVLVDFWSTWCGPCKATMPHMEKLHKKLEAQGLVVLGVCVWDDRAKFDKWQTSPEVKTSYLKVFDSAGRNTRNSIASKLYSVSGIPTFYLVGQDGTVLYSGVGSGPTTEKGLDKALAAAGFKL
jgi:thiol-disulfide isomerase/thioredoxin